MQSAQKQQGRKSGARKADDTKRDFMHMETQGGQSGYSRIRQIDVRYNNCKVGGHCVLLT